MDEQQQQQAAADAAAAAAAALAAINADAAAAAQPAQQPGMADVAQQLQALLNANAALQAQLDQIQLNAGPAAAAVGAAGAAIIIADTPGTYDVNSPLDYSSKVGIMLYNQATKALTTKFGMTSDEVVVFLQEFGERADSSGWSKGNFNVTKFATSNGEIKHIYEGYGQMTMASIEAACEDFINPLGARYDSRVRQNNGMMVTCIMATLTEDSRARLQPYATEYTRHGTIVGPLLFKVLMRLATIDSAATTESLRAKLRELYMLASSLNYDLPKLHSMYHQYYSQLVARGASVDDPIGILFNIYLSINCAEFRTYIQRKHDMYYDGELPSLTHETLMASANDKYTYLVNKGLWCQEKDSSVVALAAEVERLKGQLKLAPKLKGQLPDWKKVEGKGNGNTKGKDAGTGTKTKNKKNTRDRREQVRDEAWKKKAPAAGEPTTKRANDKTYNWCIHHMAWTLHTPSECRLGTTRTNAQNSNSRIVAHHATTEAPVTNVHNDTHESYVAAIVSNMARMALDT